MHQAAQFLHQHAAEIAWGALFFVLSLALSVLAMLAVVLRLPPTYFQGARPPPFWPHLGPWARFAAHAGKNLLGVLLLVAGAIMALPGVPGQGVLTMLVGLMLLDLPGKRAIERRIIAVPSIHRGLNRLRVRFGREPLILDETDAPADAGEA